MILTCLDVLTLIVATVNVAEVAPARTFTQSGMLAGTLLFDRAGRPHGAMMRLLPNPKCTVTPPAGAGWLSFTFPLLESPPHTPACLIVRVIVVLVPAPPAPRASAAGAPCAIRSATTAPIAPRNMPVRRSFFACHIIHPPFSLRIAVHPLFFARS